MDFFTTFISEHPFINTLLIAPILGAVLPDLLSFLKWKGWDEHTTFKPSLLLLRMGQNVVSAFVGVLGVAGITAAGGAVVGLLIWLL